MIKNLLQYPIRRTADCFFACSIPAGKWLFGKKVVNSNRFKVLKNAIDTKKYTFDYEKRIRIRNEFGITEDAFVVGHVGRFVDVKNHTFLIDIFKEITNKNNNAILLLVGEGELKASIKNKAISLGLSNKVVFTGLRDDIPNILSAMDVFVFPSLFEGLGIVAVEAQAAGLHTICADTIPSEARITDLFHYISLNEPAEKWADSIKKYDNGYKRENMQNEIVKAGYDIDASVKWLEIFYEKINSVANRR